jgi:hypothetical protein
MRGWVRDGDRLWPRFLCEPPDNPPPGACWECGGTGKVILSLDAERPDEVWPCQSCRIYCKPCGRYVPRAGHECKGKV